ncbi:MAG: type II secretion system protein GspG [Candidatus Humimicrobiaceae bacterium]
MDKKIPNGLTLIELLIVVVIGAIIVSIALPSYMVIRDMAREAATETEMLNVAKALEIYYEDYSLFPTTAEGLDELETNNYMKAVPSTDEWGREYEYNSSGNTYTLRSKGVDGVSGSDDDIVVSNGAITAFGNYNDNS